MLVQDVVVIEFEVHICAYVVRSGTCHSHLFKMKYDVSCLRMVGERRVFGFSYFVFIPVGAI